MLHYVVQGAGRGGRKLGDNCGLRGKVVSYILWNSSDISSNVKGKPKYILLTSLLTGHLSISGQACRSAHGQSFTYLKIRLLFFL